MSFRNWFKYSSELIREGIGLCPPIDLRVVPAFYGIGRRVPNALQPMCAIITFSRYLERIADSGDGLAFNSHMWNAFHLPPHYPSNSSWLQIFFFHFLFLFLCS